MINKNILKKKYLLEFKSISQIATELNCCHSTVHRRLIKFGIPRRNFKESIYDSTLTKDFLRREYIDKRKSTLAIAKEIGCSGETIRRYLILNKIQVRDINKENNPMFGNPRKDLQIKFKGTKNPGYIDGRTPLTVKIRGLLEYREWRRKVFKRDNFECQNCGQTGQYLNCHHKVSFSKLLEKFIKEYNQFSPIEDKETLVRLAMKWKPFWDVNNGIAFCDECHKIKHKIKSKVDPIVREN